MSRRAASLGSILAVMLALAAPIPARAAAFGGPSLLSLAPGVQFDEADSSVVSADGAHVVFRGTLGGETGLWRRDLASGEVDPVAVGLAGVTDSSDPQAPSVSADGRYVAFSTQAALDPVHDTNGTWDVYVRDMDVAVGQPGAYTLASAVDGGLDALTYGPAGSGAGGAHTAGWQTNPGSPSPNTSAPGGAISADGTEVVFSVDSPSNLLDPADTSPTSVQTPPDQVALRNLATGRTSLVSVAAASGPAPCAPDPEPAAVCWNDPLGGGQGGAVGADDAVISADGTTAAWLSPLGAIEQESTYLPGEEFLDSQDDGLADLYPVWRRIAAGPGAPTLRVTGAVDPAAGGCPPGSTVNGNQIPAGCAGPLSLEGTTPAFSHVVLSADGYTAVVLTHASLAANNNNGNAEAYLVDMHPGLTRIQATRALTQAAANTGGEADIVADAISGDANTVLLSTSRTDFNLTTPRYIGPTRTGTAAGNELYVVDLAQNTIDLVTHGYDGTSADYASCPRFPFGTYSPSLDSDGGTIAFDSCADNLVWGDGNGASDVFAASALATVPVSAPAQQPGFLPPAAAPVAWGLHLTTAWTRSRRLVLDIVVPGAGRLTAAVQGPVAVATRGGRARVRERTVGQTHARSRPGGGLVVLHLRLRSGARLVEGAHGARVSVTITFTAAGHRALHRRLSLLWPRSRGRA